MGFLADWNLSYEEIDELLTHNPSLRSFVSGYAAELKCRDLYFSNDDRASNVFKYDDHDRTKKGDICITYRGQIFNIEVKSLQTNSIKGPRNPPKRPKLGWTSPYPFGTTKIATFQCDASDRRKVKFKDGSEVETTSLLVGEFDVLAVNLHGFHQDWVFAFAKNFDLPRIAGLKGASKNYTEYQKSNLLSTSMPIYYPTPGGIYRSEPWALFDELITEREAGQIPDEIAEIEIVKKKDEAKVDE